MSGDFVEERERRDARHLGDEARVSEREADEERFLFAGRGGGRRRLLRPVPDHEVAEMGPDQGAAGGGVAGAVVAEDRAVAVLRRQRRPASGHRLDLALERKLRPGKRRRIVALGGDQRFEAAHAFEPSRGDGDAEFGRLALDRAKPRQVPPALVQEPVPPAQGPFELADPRAVIGVDRQHEAVEEPAPLSCRPGEQRIHRRG